MNEAKEDGSARPSLLTAGIHPTLLLRGHVSHAAWTFVTKSMASHCAVPVCIRPVLLPPRRIVYERPVVHRIKYIDVVRAPPRYVDRQRFLSDSDSESSCSSSEVDEPRTKKVTKKKKFKAAPPRGKKSTIPRAKMGETAVRVSGGYRVYDDEDVYRGKNMRLDEGFDADRDARERRPLEDDVPIKYDDRAQHRTAPAGHPTVCCCCCCQPPRRRRSRKPRHEELELEPTINLELLAKDLSRLSDGALGQLALTASAALAHGMDDDDLRGRIHHSGTKGFGDGKYLVDEALSAQAAKGRGRTKSATSKISSKSSEAVRDASREDSSKVSAALVNGPGTFDERMRAFRERYL